MRSSVACMPPWSVRPRARRTAAHGLDVIPPGVHGGVADLDRKGELAVRLARDDRALRPLRRSAAVAPHVAPEAHALGRTGGTVEPLRFERLWTETAGVG